MKPLVLIRRKRTILTLLTLFLVTAAMSVKADQSPGCHEIEVVYEGREFVFAENGVDYYRWTYTLYGDSCIARALSHWTLEFCGEFLGEVSEVSTLSIDQSDPAHGDTSAYLYEVGFDPVTGLTGLKWELDWGNELDAYGEYDTFSFVSPGNEDPEYPVTWVSKGGHLFDAGTTVGPGCFPPVPVEKVTWGQVKARMR